MAITPKRVTGDSGSVEQHSLDELIRADKYITNKENAAAGMLSVIKIVRFAPCGTVV